MSDTKSMPFMLGIPEAFPQSRILEYDDARSVDRFRLREGSNLPTDTMLEFRSTAKPDVLLKWDVLPNSALVLVVNQRVADLLFAAVPNDVQLLAARIAGARDAVVPGYYVVNVLRVIRGIDWSKSVAARFADGSLRTFKQLSFVPDCLGDAHVALEDECRSFTLLSEELVRRFRDKNVKGVKFERAEDVHW